MGVIGQGFPGWSPNPCHDHLAEAPDLYTQVDDTFIVGFIQADRVAVKDGSRGLQPADLMGSEGCRRATQELKPASPIPNFRPRW